MKSPFLSALLLLCAFIRSDASSSTCKDDETFTFNVISSNSQTKTVGCSWVAKKNLNYSTRLCQDPNSNVEGLLVARRCPVTCRRCPVTPCQDDDTFQFVADNKARTCTWLAEMQTNDLYLYKHGLCSGYNDEGQLIAENCPKACNSCAKKPHILLIFADDIGQGDIPLYWDSSGVDMPNIQRLSEKGVTFHNAHSSPICAPSRYMILSGNHPHRGRSLTGSTNIIDGSQFEPNQPTIAELLQVKGNYNTFMTGKHHLGGSIPLKEGATKKDIDKDHELTGEYHDWNQTLIGGPQSIGFTESYITQAGIQMGPYAFFKNGYLNIDPSDAVYWDGGRYIFSKGEKPHRLKGTSMIPDSKPAEGDPDWDSTAFNQILVEKTANFIDSHLQRRPQDPMFMYVSLGAAHAPFTPPLKYIDGEKLAKAYQSKRMAILKEMDLVVGSLVSMIEGHGLEKDTMIIFTSDNGGFPNDFDIWNDHFTSGGLRGSKGYQYEGGHRVPLIIQHDTVYPKNQRRDRLVGLNDFYTTLSDVAGVTIWDDKESAQDSMSFAKYIMSEEATEGMRNTQSTFRFSGSGGKSRLAFETIQNEKFKVIRNVTEAKDWDGTISNSIELYDLEVDIGERNDLSGDASHEDMIKDMLKQLREEGPCPLGVEGDDLCDKYWLCDTTSTSDYCGKFWPY